MKKRYWKTTYLIGFVNLLFQASKRHCVDIDKILLATRQKTTSSQVSSAVQKMKEEDTLHLEINVFLVANSVDPPGFIYIYGGITFKYLERKK